MAAFGQAPSPFGAPSTGFSFGGAAASSTPAFGAASAPAFGAPATSTPSLFGASSTPAFGAATSTPAFGTSTFGSSTPAFGASSTPAFVKRELESIATAYMPGHSSYRFQHIFLNVLDNPAQKVKPAAVVDELSWKQAMRDAGGPDNPDRLWPVAANGFDDLVKRTQAQAEGLAANRARLTELREHAYKQAQRQAGIIARVARAREQHMELSNRLLGVARHVDGLEGRIASFMGLRGELSRGKEANLSRALEAVEAQLSPTSPAGLQRRLDALAAACRLRASSGTLGMGGSTQGGVKLDEASLAQLFAVLKEHVEGLKQLQEVLRRDVLDVEIMRGVRQDSIVPAAMNMAPVELI
ncbi:hypothetical protein OEZ86_006581 [Tetradesmus obliquus]|nr:hypothetical protein OEZ86_006581 [Tetradesmus obliquus]